jgi:hypothetical protein
MAIIRISKSGKGFQVIDDEGHVFITSVEYIRRLLDGRFSGPFLLLTRLPNDVSTDRFGTSPVWNPDNGTVTSSDISDSELSTNNDALSQKVLKKLDAPVKDVIL